MKDTKPHQHRRPIRVLHVEGEKDEQRLLRGSFEGSELCIQIKSASSPEEAILMLEEDVFDCVIAEYRLPGMDGLELARRVRHSSDVPLIIYTAHGSERVAAEALSSGVDAYVPKGVHLENVELLAGRVMEVVERWRAERGRAATTDVLQVLSRLGNKEEALREIMVIVRRYTGVEAVGIRLQEGDDYPYYVYDGFPDEHILKENSLCAYNLEGQLMRDEVGSPMLECMCGNILRGRFDASKPFFTEGGSFWTNSTTALLASTSEEDRLARTRNVCSGEGYESVALIPIRGGAETIGLLQLNDIGPDRFNLEMIRFLEGLAGDIGTVLAGLDQRDRLRESMEEHRAIFDSVRDPIFLVDVDDFTVLRSNAAAHKWLLSRKTSPRAETCHQALTGRALPCELYGEACPILDMLECGEGVSEVYPRFNGDDKGLYLEESANPVRDAEGRIFKAVLILRNITER